MQRRRLLQLAMLVAGGTLTGPRTRAAAAGDAPRHGPAVRPAAPMASARAAHTATALRDGRVLVVGGFTAEEGQVAGAELYEPARDRWVVADGAVHRQSHSATRLADGRVLIAGGYAGSGAVLDSAELFDPSTGRFTPAGTLATARAGHEAVLLVDGSVLMVGGVTTSWTFLASAEAFDPTTGRFAATGSMTIARESHVAVRMTDGRVLVVGGHRGRGPDIEIVASAEIFDPRTGRFAPTAPLGTSRHKHDAVRLDTGQVLVSGGADEGDDRGVYATTEVFDPAVRRFRPGPNLRRGRYKHRGTSVALPLNRVLFAGGSDHPEVLDLATGTSRIIESREPLAGQFPAVARLASGRVLVAGGYGGGLGPRSGAWIVEP